MHLFKELAFALEVIRRYLEALGLPQTRALLRLDGLSGTGAVMADLDGFFVMRGKDSTVLDHPSVQARLHLPPDAHFSRPESTLVRTLYDCPDVPVGPEGCPCRVVVASHLATEEKSRIGRTRKGVVYDLFFTHLPQDGFTASDVVALYLHRGAFEPVLADEDDEQDPDRWCSHAPAGQEAWQIVFQWIWNVLLELGHQVEPTPLRATRFAPPIPSISPHTAPPSGYAPPSGGLALESGPLLWSRLSSPAGGRGAVPQGRSLLSRSGAGKPMAACVWCMPPAFAVAAPVRCVSSASGMAAPPRNRARSVSCRIRCRWVLLPCSGTPPAAESIDGPACGSCDTSASR